MNKRRNQFTFAWHDHEFPLFTREYRKLVRCPATREKGALRNLALSIVEESLRSGLPTKTPIERVEEKIDELLRMLRHGVSLPLACDVIQAEEEQNDTGLSSEDKERLNKMLCLT